MGIEMRKLFYRIMNWLLPTRANITKNAEGTVTGVSISLPYGIKASELKAAQDAVNATNVKSEEEK